MTKQRRQNIQAMQNLFNNIGRVDRQKALIGKLDASGNVSSDAQEGLQVNQVWVRLVTTGRAIAVLNTSVKPVPGIEVWIEKPSSTEEWVVTGLTNEGIRQLGVYAPSVSVPDVIAAVNNTVVDPRSLDTLRAKFIGGFNVEISNGLYIKRDGTVASLGGGVVNLSSEQPAGPNEKVLIIIGVDEITGLLTYATGSPANSLQPPTSNLLFSNSAIRTLQNSATATNPQVSWLYATSITDSDTGLSNVRRLRNLWIYPRPARPFVKFDSPATLTISGGTVDAAGSRFITLQSEVGTTDDLDTLNDIGTGEEVVLIADSGDTITVKHGTGNIETDSGADIALTGNKILKLLSIDGTTLRQYT